MRPRRLVRDLQPAAEIPRLDPGRLIPADPDAPTRTGTSATDPSHRTAASSPAARTPPARRRTPPTGTDHHTVAVNQPIRLEQIPGRLKRPLQRHHQPRQLPRHIPVVDHEQRNLATPRAATGDKRENPVR